LPLPQFTPRHPPRIGTHELALATTLAAALIGAAAEGLGGVEVAGGAEARAAPKQGKARQTTLIRRAFMTFSFPWPSVRGYAYLYIENGMFRASRARRWE
jgi:hypothetical protein